MGTCLWITVELEGAQVRPLPGISILSRRYTSHVWMLTCTLPMGSQYRPRETSSPAWSKSVAATSTSKRLSSLRSFSMFSFRYTLHDVRKAHLSDQHHTSHHTRAKTPSQLITWPGRGCCSYLRARVVSCRCWRLPTGTLLLEYATTQWKPVPQHSA